MKKNVFCKEWTRYETITDELKTACSRYSDHVVFTWKGNSAVVVKTFREFEGDLLKYAAYFSARPEHHFGFICSNVYESYLYLYSIMVAGKIAIPIEANQPLESLQNCLNKADVDVLLFNDYYDDYASLEGVSLCSYDSVRTTTLEAWAKWPQWENDRPACMVFTSGTGGEKACVVLTQQNIGSINALSCAGEVFSCGHKTIMFLPLYHAFAISIATVCIDCGATMYLNKGVRHLASEMAEVKPDFLVTVPAVNEMFQSKIKKSIQQSGLEYSFSVLIKLSNALRKLKIDIRRKAFAKVLNALGGNLKVIICGGAAVPSELVEFFDNLGICVLQGYGMTESTCAISMNTVTQNKIGTTGVVFPFNEVKISENGEIWVRGDNIMKGYYKNDLENQRIFIDGWLRTGDLGSLDNDGFLKITGRIKNLIILSNGENISPEELEKEFYQRAPISEIVVTEKNKHLHALVYSDQIDQIGKDILCKEIDNIIDNRNRENPVYKRIASWELRETPFEKTGTMKIKRGAL